MKKVILMGLLSLFCVQTWACSCPEDDTPFFLIENLGGFNVVEAVATENLCEGVVLKATDVISSYIEINVGDSLKLWRGYDSECISSFDINVGDTVFLWLDANLSSSYINPIDCGTLGFEDVEPYLNFQLDDCSDDGYSKISNGTLGSGNLTVQDVQDVLNAASENDGATFLFRLLLEGAYDKETGLMQSNLTDVLPLTQPFNVPPYHYTGTESFEALPENVVDWVLVEAREGDPQVVGERGTVTVETRAALLDKWGRVFVEFDNLEADHDYYFCIRHRNHLDVMTSGDFHIYNSSSTKRAYDFTLDINRAFGSQQQKWNEDETKAMMFTGDYNQDGVIQLTDFDYWMETPAVIDTYSSADGTLDGVIQLTDFDAWLENKAKIGTPEIDFE